MHQPYAAHNQGFDAALLEMERQSGFTFQHGRSLEEIARLAAQPETPELFDALPVLENPCW